MKKLTLYATSALAAAVFGASGYALGVNVFGQKVVPPTQTAIVDPNLQKPVDSSLSQSLAQAKTASYGMYWLKLNEKMLVVSQSGNQITEFDAPAMDQSVVAELSSGKYFSTLEDIEKYLENLDS